MDKLNEASADSVMAKPASDQVRNDGTGQYTSTSNLGLC